MNEPSPTGVLVADVVIIGAGPAGCSAALALVGSGMKVILVDKAVFPRNKTCGDSVPAHALLALENLFPGVYESFLKKVPFVTFRSSALIFPNGKKFLFSWPLPGYVAERSAFDAFLLDKVLETNEIQVMPGCKITGIEQEDSLFRLDTTGGDGTNGPTLVSSRVIACDGAPSLAARMLCGYSPDAETYGQAVRCYYEGVTGLEPGMEYVFYHPKFFPGYFWIFPMTGGRVNAGFGMQEKYRKMTGSSLDSLFYGFIEQHGVVKQMLQNARQVGKIRGGMVPFAMKRQPWSGPGFLIAGDAASLVDPVSGDGIMMAVRSGLLAGFAVRYGKESRYDQDIEKFVWSRMATQRRVIIFLSRFPGLISIASALGHASWFRNRILRWIW